MPLRTGSRKQHGASIHATGIIKATEFMKALPEGQTIILAGNWNPHIFSPPWLKRHLFEDSSVELAIALGQPGFAARISAAGLTLLINQQRVQLSADSSDPTRLSFVQDTAVKILDLLPHTPIIAVGVNFQFKETPISFELANRFNLPDLKPLADDGLVRESSTIRHRLSFMNLMLNLSYTLDEASILFDFNFHKEVADTGEALAFLREINVCDFRTKAFEVLKTTYQVS